MALSEFQRGVCRLIAGGRIASGESYVAGGAALNELLQAARRSHDIDLFHDTAEAVLASLGGGSGTVVARGLRGQGLLGFSLLLWRPLSKEGARQLCYNGCRTAPSVFSAA